jgi:hypothetical protein
MLQEIRSRYIWNIESMAHDDDRRWMLLSPSTVEWQAGLEKFIGTIFEGTYASEAVITSYTKQKTRFSWTC